ncbi:SRPBCC family protein [Sanguibacter suaedae]|uniref:SRPBCC family protein n=1 Tax=Sanguibacter suaedae TaxID=2795737 RepID=A0A934I5N4_9MICO|nr:SRPBCC family protein [Sanguibacter suaedae]MBI9115668.1 SRPBCC family protein [Sanguibacter suaedae]
MKFTVSIEIASPRETVVQLLEDPVHRPRWLRGLVSHETVRGEDGQVGTESRVVFRAGQQTMECTETVTRREPADLRDVPADRVIHFEREIVAEGMWNAARERLTPRGPEGTLWVSENEYRFTGMMRLVAPLLRGSFKKQTRQHMEDFKAFAEAETDVRRAEG